MFDFYIGVPQQILDQRVTPNYLRKRDSRPQGSLGYLLLKWQGGELTLYGGGTRNATKRMRVDHLKHDGRAFIHVLFAIASKLSERAQAHEDEETFLRMGVSCTAGMPQVAELG